MKQRNLKLVSWLLFAVVVALAFVVWAQQRLDGKPLSLYDYFPLLGLTAFSVMWTHYIVGGLRRYVGLSVRENKDYFKYTSIFVLVCILLHPSLLILQLNKDGFGLPPGSYLQVYPGLAMKIALMAGTVSLLTFLAFEFKGKFGKKPWWKVVDFAQLLAMIFILYHGFALGRELSVGWFRIIWVFYGVSFIAVGSYNYWYDIRVVKKES